LTINCAALPEHLIESELFGYVKGAFTGANQNKQGLFEEAHKGTIFLNEIGDIPLRLQGKLLDALENQRIRRLGQSKSITVDVRIIAASNIDLEKAVNDGRFREDLFYRLNVLPIKVPPLRERKDDIPFLIKHFLDRHCPLMNKNITEIAQEAMDILLSYPYPGNVRELENIIQHSIIMIKGSILIPEYLPEKLKRVKSYEESNNLADMERKMIETALHDCQGHFSRAAKKLGIHRTTLWRKIKQLGVKLPNYDA
jgi:two-component system response regulator HydG